MRNLKAKTAILALAVAMPAMAHAQDDGQIAPAAQDREDGTAFTIASYKSACRWAFALFPLINSGGTAQIIIAISIMLIFVSMMYGPQAALFAEMFPKHVRYSDASLGHQIGSVFGGGFATIIATALYAQFETSASISIYLAAACVISLMCILVLGSGTTAYANH